MQSSETQEREKCFFSHLLMINKAADMGLPWMLVQMSLMIKLITSVPVVATTSVAKLDYPNKCGDVEVPYPFGLNEGCSLNEGY